MRKLWLIFAQAATVSLAVLFVVSTLRPDLLTFGGRNGGIVTVRETQRPAADTDIGSYSTAAKKSMGAVVNIFTSKDVKAPRHPFMDDPVFRRFFGDQFDGEPQRSASLGSGVIVGAEGFILTNHHVIDAADGIEVALADGRKLPARVVGTDPDTDLAVLKVEGKDLPAITFGQSDNLQVGDVVLAIGNPFGVGQTVTMGIVSALGRSHLGINTFENFIQTDAAINPGNSGGALVDASGSLVGVNSAIYSRSGGSMGIGFAIPVSIARQVFDQIITTGSVTRGWIGVEVQDLTAELAESFKLPNTEGTLIAGVLKNGPADRGGIKPGDILVGVEGKPVTDSSSMLNLVAALQPGKQATLRLLRGGNEVKLKITVGKRPRPQRREE
ncbi:MAG: Do family serine endopeptidase [Burkholderiales bacterium]|nr:Do family serine endopeptidase [Burkholderiales bacterium]